MVVMIKIEINSLTEAPALLIGTPEELQIILETIVLILQQLAL